MKPIEEQQLTFLDISFRKDLDVLFCRWRLHVELPQFVEGYRAAMQFARQHRAHFWLHDLRMRNIASPREHGWFYDTVVPEAEATMEPGIAIAYLMSPRQRQVLVPGGSSESETISLSPFIQVRYFTHEHNALVWLQECRRRILPV